MHRFKRQILAPFIFYGTFLFLAYLGFKLNNYLIFFLALPFIYARFVEPYIIKIKNFSIEVESALEPIKIIFVSDLQIGGHKKTRWLNRVLKKINGLNPDLVLFGGDLIANEGDTNENTYLEIFNNLSSPAAAVLGNHEYGVDYDLRNDKQKQVYPNLSKEVTESLNKAGVKVLSNDKFELIINKQKVCVYGTDELWAKKLEWKTDQLRSDTNVFLVLTHNPDSIITYPNGVKKPDLFLSGHTHGGQVNLPFANSVLNLAKIKLGEKFYSGLRSYGKNKILISKGIGESFFPIRFFSFPEICLINFIPKK